MIKRNLILNKKIYKPLKFKIIKLNNIFSFIRIFGFLGYLDIKLKNDDIFYINNNSFIFKFQNIQNFYSFLKKLKISFIGLSFGWFIKLEILGRGFFVESFKNLILFNIGYTHAISCLLPISIFCIIEDSKKSSFILHGINYSKLLNFCFYIKQKLKKFNIYKGIGIKLSNDIYKLKAGKSGNKQ